MPDIFYLISRWWKQIFLLTGISLLVVAAVVYFQPSRYLSVATALPASSFQSDKASIFNNNIQELYPSIGEPDDLDRILGTARLDTVYLAVADSFNLWDHYKTEEKGKAALTKAAISLKKYSKVTKSDYGELKVKVWDTDKNLAPELANAILDQLNTIHRELQNESNKYILNNLLAKRNAQRSFVDSVFTTGHAQAANADQYQQLIFQYQLMVDTKPSVLLVVEKARPSERPILPKVN